LKSAIQERPAHPAIENVSVRCSATSLLKHFLSDLRSMGRQCWRSPEKVWDGMNFEAFCGESQQSS
jgi:hypothetical protein